MPKFSLQKFDPAYTAAVERVAKRARDVTYNDNNNMPLKLCVGPEGKGSIR